MNEETFGVRLDALDKAVEQNNRALRGYNGEPGLVARVIGVEKTLERITTNDLPHLKQELLLELVHFKDAMLKEFEDIRGDAKKSEEDSITFKLLREKLFGPIVVSIITAILVSVIHGIWF